jgi:membrane protein DedA with SNARE-associated domain/membrane-associated phospholipid phosphatase
VIKNTALFLPDILKIIARYPYTAYLLVFLVSLSESLAVVGLLVPGTVIMFGVGAVISTGVLSLKWTLILAMTGAVAGDGISYWLGRYYHHQLRSFWPFKRHPQMLSRGESFFQRHGGKSILFGRFIGPLRPVIPLVAGMLDMPRVRFALVNILSAVGWGFAYVLPGFFLGTSLAVLGVVSTRLTVLILLTLFGVWFAVWLFRKLVVFLLIKGPGWLAALEDRISAATPIRGVMRYFKRFLLFVFRPRKGEEYLIALLLLIALLMGFGFLAVLEEVIARDPLVRADQAVYHFLQSLRSPLGDRIFVSVTELGDGIVSICVAGSVLIILLLKRCYRTAGYWVATLFTAELLTRFFKWSLQLQRPVHVYEGVFTFGFPSAHATMSIVLYGFLAFLIARGSKSPLRWFPLVGALLISFLVAFSRLYLGVHWLSDVLGGSFLGCTWTALAGIAYLREPAEAIPRRLLGFFALVMFFAAGSWHVHHQSVRDIAKYAPRRVVQTIGSEAWVENQWKDLPEWRIDLAGEREQPLTVQWAGRPENLVRHLTSKGWHEPPSLSPKAFLGMLSPAIRLGDLPLLPHLHNGYFEKIRLVRYQEGQRLVFRLWPTRVRLKDPPIPLWVGTVEIQTTHRIAGWITVAKDTGDYIRPLDILSRSLDGNVWSREKFHHFRECRRQVLEGLIWDGRVLLASEMIPN